MNRSYQKDIWRSIQKGWKRFFSILIITALGVAMLTGLYAACLDLYYSADQFFDEQRLFDIRILSTLGLTQEDVDVFLRVDGVEAAEGAYSEAVHTDVAGVRKSADMTVLSEKGLNALYLFEGALPTKAGEIAVTQGYLMDSGKSIGSTLMIAEDIADNPEDAETGSEQESVLEGDGPNTDIDVDTELELEEETEAPTFLNTVYTITGVVMDPMDIQSDSGMANLIRSTANSDYTFFITSEEAKNDVFTAVYLTLTGTRGMICYSDEYEAAVQAVIGNIEQRIKAQREQARYESVLTEARTKIMDAEGTMYEKFAEADEKFADAWNDIAEAEEELKDGEVTLSDEQKDAKRKIADARTELENAKQELADAEKKLIDGEAELLEGEAELNENEQKLERGKERLAEGQRQAAEQFAAAERQLSDAQNQLDAGRAQLETGIAQLKNAFGAAWPADEWNALVNAAATLAAQGADDDAIASGTGNESALLAHTLQGRAGAISAALTQQRNELQAALSTLNQRIEYLGPQIEAAARLAADAGDTLALKQSAADAAQGDLNTEVEKLGGLTEGTVEYETQLSVVSSAQSALDAANAAVDAAQAALDAANKAVSDLTDEREAKTAEAAGLTAAIGQLDIQAAQLPALPTAGTQAALGMGKVTGGQQALDAQQAVYLEQKEAALEKLAEGETELAAGEAQLKDARKTIEEKKAELEDGKVELEDGKNELADGQKKLNREEADAKRKIADAWEEIADGKVELEDGKAELAEKGREYADKKEEAVQKLADAYAELDDIDMTQWYVQDRTSLESYSSLNSDLSSIEAIGTVFPIIFLPVAVLVSLTTMTRMVEEERGLIGTYKALGFRSAAIYRKYILFAVTACLLGGILGDILGFVFLPKFVAVVLKELYYLPRYYLRFDILYGVGGVLLFMAGVVGATALTCRGELDQMPAILMRPKAPRAGSRVLLERIPAVWKRLKFLNKVTVRNLFRYKKRLFMTIGGIMGCTALILCGFAIKDSIADPAPKQYEDIYRYDLMAVFEEDGNDTLIRQLSSDGNVDDLINLRIESVKLSNAGGASEKAQLMVIPDNGSIAGYIHMENLDGALAHPDDGGIVLTRNAARILGLKAGDTVLIQDMELVQREAAVSGVVQNYLGNNVYMTQSLYETLFGEYVPNSVLAHLSGSTDQRAYAKALLDDDSVLSSISTTALNEDFGFDLMDAVMFLIIVMAGGLAFVVLFTLSNTNISERVRELATIKVLGFYDNEVHQYVNKETLILTAAGILLGLPVGRALSGLLTNVLNMPSIHFAVHIEPVSYLISAGVTFCFAIVVNWLTNHTLDRINMVEALKSVE